MSELAIGTVIGLLASLPGLLTFAMMRRNNDSGNTRESTLLEVENKELHKQMDALAKRLSSAEMRVAALEGQVAERDRLIEQLRGQVAGLISALNQARVNAVSVSDEDTRFARWIEEYFTRPELEVLAQDSLVFDKLSPNLTDAQFARALVDVAKKNSKLAVLRGLAREAKPNAPNW